MADFSNLPGLTAHERLSPAHRKPTAEYLQETTDYKTAAVLALVVPDNDGDANLLLIQRSSGGGDVHAGQISFPGGKCEEGEKVLETALRETLEEIGVESQLIRVHGPLSALYIPPSRFLVYPFIASVISKPAYVLNTDEVNAVLEIPLHHFFQKETIQTGEFGSARGYQVKAPYYLWESTRIWGATAMMISEVVMVLSSEKKEDFV